MDRRILAIVCESCGLNGGHGFCIRLRSDQEVSELLPKHLQHWFYIGCVILLSEFLLPLG